jgi:hypothetical protein
LAALSRRLDRLERQQELFIEALASAVRTTRQKGSRRSS